MVVWILNMGDLQMNKESENTLLNVSDSTSNANDQNIFDESHCSSSNNDNSMERSNLIIPIAQTNGV